MQLPTDFELNDFDIIRKRVVNFHNQLEAVKKIQIWHSQLGPDTSFTMKHLSDFANYFQIKLDLIPKDQEYHASPRRELKNHLEIYPYLGQDSNPLFEELKKLELISSHSPLQLELIAQLFDRFDSDEMCRSWRGQIHLFDFYSILNTVLLEPSVAILLSRNMPLGEFLNFCRENQKSCLIITDWGYPFGGAEAFFHETAEFLTSLGFRIDWVNFQVPGKGIHRQNEVIIHDTYTEYKKSEYPTNLVFKRIVSELRPKLVFTHGIMNAMGAEYAEEFDFQLVGGFHFWTGLIELGDKYNYGIAENITDHKIFSTNFDRKSPRVHRYLVSNFMLDIYTEIGGNADYRIINPILHDEFNEYPQNKSKGWVSQLDLSTGKGGHIFCDLVEALGKKIPFFGIVRDSTDESVKQRLKDLATKYPLLKLSEYENFDYIAKNSSLVLVPSLVDETYSRISDEAVRAGIPVLTSDRGNLKTLLGGLGAIPPENIPRWKETVQDIYSNAEAQYKLWGDQRSFLQSSAMSSGSIKHLIFDAIKNLRLKKIGIFTVDAPQGLGTLAKVFSKVFDSCEIQTHIFAFAPYKEGLKLDSYWEDSSAGKNNRVYHSGKKREQVSLSDLIDFVDKTEIQAIIFPEICWEENWKRILELKQKRNGLKIIGVPMLETVLRQEIGLLNELDLTLFPTLESEKILGNYGVSNGKYIGFTAPFENSENIQECDKNLRTDNRTIKFLHLAGHNPSVRKQTGTVISEFMSALKLRQDIHLTIVLQHSDREIDAIPIPQGIEIIRENLTDSQIRDLYLKHDVSIQISSHEGLGIGFFESIALGIPVVTLNHSPHNEVIVNEESGWNLPCNLFDLPDNRNGVVKAAKLVEGKLAEFLLKISKSEVRIMSEKTQKFYMKKFSNSGFASRVISAMIPDPVHQETFTVAKLEKLYSRVLVYFFRTGKKYLLPYLSIRIKYHLKKIFNIVDFKIAKLTKIK